MDRAVNNLVQVLHVKYTCISTSERSKLIFSRVQTRPFPPSQSQGCSGRYRQQSRNALAQLTHLAVPDLVQRWHDIQPHELRSLGDNRVSLHCSNRGDFAILRLIGREL